MSSDPEVVEVITKDLIRKDTVRRERGREREMLSSLSCSSRVPSTPDPSGLSVIMTKEEFQQIKVSTAGQQFN